jgi:uncharacterized membrane protein YqaE (UPF0057 family)
MRKINSFVPILIALLVLSNLSSGAAALATITPSRDSAEIKMDAALKEFRDLPRSERKARMKEARKVWKEYRADKKAGISSEGDNKVLQIILSILLPPVAVLIHEDGINTKFWISILLTLLFWIPGVIYALLVVTDNA